MHVKGSTQGPFMEDGTRAGKGKSLVVAVRFRGEVPHDVRHGKHAVTKHEPISVVHEWGPTTAQFLSALWANEVLDEVGLEFVRQDSTGKEEVYATLTLSKATVAYVELQSGAAERAAGEWRPHDDVGLYAEKIEFMIKSGSGKVTATYDAKRS
jgi:type VI secretion system Hcp family effector